jgi:hypothetical protein
VKVNQSMKRNVLVMSAVLVLIASACAPQAAPTVNPADVAGTAQAAAFTMVAQTQQAAPTNTPVPTETASPIPSPTNTVPPLPTQSTQTTQEALVPGAGLPTTLPTFTPQSPSGSGNNQDPCNQALTTWQGPTANFTIVNKTKPQGKITMGIYVVTEMGQCGNLVIAGDSFSGPAGQYSASAFIDGKQHFKAFGSFRITGGNWKIVVTNNSITAAGSCYPNC